MSRTLTGARARQLRRRLHRASRRNLTGPPPAPFVDVTETADRRALGDARNHVGRLETLIARERERIARLERRLGRRS